MTFDHETLSATLDLAQAEIDDPRKTIKRCNDILEHPRQELGESIYCRAHLLRGFGNRLLGNFSEAETDLLFAKQLAESLADDAFIASAAMQLGLFHMEQHHDALAISMLELSIEKHKAINSKNGEAKALFTLANALWHQENEEQALFYVKEALILFTLIDSDDGITAVHSFIANVYISRGKYADALERIELGLAMQPTQTRVKNRVVLLLGKAVCCNRLGQTERAREILESAIEHAHTGGYYFQEARGLLHPERLLRDRGDQAEADRLVTLVETLAKQHGFEPALAGLKASAEFTM